ncbi:hypothetical protein EDB89DRAFT_1911920 [Lactarius sanguifluus]|nr:hypothetical protein EDB89DRAFT_1911920 [Lactarius sanguifluus]
MQREQLRASEWRFRSWASTLRVGGAGEHQCHTDLDPTNLLQGYLASPPHLTSIAVSFLGPTREGNQVNIQPHPTSVPPHLACKPLRLKKALSSPHSHGTTLHDRSCPTPYFLTLQYCLVNTTSADRPEQTRNERHKTSCKTKGLHRTKQVTVLPPPTMRIRELEQENPNLLRKNNKLRHQTTHADKTPISLDGPAL